MSQLACATGPARRPETASREARGRPPPKAPSRLPRPMSSEKPDANPDFLAMKLGCEPRIAPRRRTGAPLGRAAQPGQGRRAARRLVGLAAQLRRSQERREGKKTLPPRHIAGTRGGTPWRRSRHSAPSWPSPSASASLSRRGQRRPIGAKQSQQGHGRWRGMMAGDVFWREKSVCSAAALLAMVRRCFPLHIAPTSGLASFHRVTRFLS